MREECMEALVGFAEEVGWGKAVIEAIYVDTVRVHWCGTPMVNARQALTGGYSHPFLTFQVSFT